jgi:hypothetical protein
MYTQARGSVRLNAVRFLGLVSHSAESGIGWSELPTLCDSNGTTFGGYPLRLSIVYITGDLCRCVAGRVCGYGHTW